MNENVIRRSMKNRQLKKDRERNPYLILKELIKEYTPEKDIKDYTDGTIYDPWEGYVEHESYFDCCSGCSNNPKNGGSGICHCTLPYMNNGYQFQKLIERYGARKQISQDIIDYFDKKYFSFEEDVYTDYDRLWIELGRL